LLSLHSGFSEASYQEHSKYAAQVINSVEKHCDLVGAKGKDAQHVQDGNVLGRKLWKLDKLAHSVIDAGASLGNFPTYGI